MAPLHGTGIPHVDSFGVSPWVQWGVLGVILLVGCWLMLDTRGASASAHRQIDDQADEFDGPLVVGRKRGASTGVAAARSADSAPVAASSGAIAGVPADRQQETIGGEGKADSLPPGTSPPGKAGGGSASSDSGTKRRAARSVFGQAVAVPIWLNPIRVLTAVIGVGAGIQAMDRVREIMELDALLGSAGTLQVSRLALWLTVLLFVGSALAMPAPRLAALAFAGAAALAAFFAVAGWWESRLEWWGAEYALTAWSNEWVWAAIGLVLAGLALLGGWYRPRRADIG